MPDATPDIRIRAVNAAPVRGEGRYVVYWMTAQRRLRFNFAWQRAAECAAELRKPLVVLEALRCDYPWASDRLHAFVLAGMRDHSRRLAGGSALYFPYVEPAVGAGKGLLAALAAEACLVVADDFPAFFLPRMLSRAGDVLPVRLEAVDSNGLLPLAAADREFATAHAFRRFLQRSLPEHLAAMPREDPLAGARLPPAPRLTEELLRRWPTASGTLLSGNATALAELPIDHTVRPAPWTGGEAAAMSRLETFLSRGLDVYPDGRNHPDDDAGSGFSPYLHFGHLSAHEVFARLAEREGWSPERLGTRATGSREGWWGMSAPAEAFLDQLVTWRELGFNCCARRPDYDRYESLPDWARRTLERHAADPRSQVYALEEFERAATHDPVWNAAQRQLLREGRLHNYLRMLWGKKVLHWSASPREALETMVELNDKYALDGRDPNSYSGICWCLGRYDRPWGPERPIFGTVRYMTSDSTVRKLRLKRYVEKYSEAQSS